MTLGCLLGVLSSQEMICITYEVCGERHSINGSCEVINMLINERCKHMIVTHIGNIDGTITIHIEFKYEVSK